MRFSRGTECQVTCCGIIIGKLARFRTQISTKFNLEKLVQEFRVFGIKVQIRIRWTLDAIYLLCGFITLRNDSRTEPSTPVYAGAALSVMDQLFNYSIQGIESVLWVWYSETLECETLWEFVRPSVPLWVMDMMWRSHLWLNRWTSTQLIYLGTEHLVSFVSFTSRAVPILSDCIDCFPQGRAKLQADGLTVIDSD